MNFFSTALLSVALLISAPDSKKDKKYYDEDYRPQYHFSPERNWMNDPNGLVYYDGEYHLFYQYNPNGNEWGYMHWGHAISTDLLHWEHLPIAIFPDENSTDKERCTAFSGSVIVDENNLLGKQSGEFKTLVAFYTSQHCGQRIAFSTDKGRTWTKYEENPVIPYDEKDDARDPKVIWHKESQKWVMALYRKTSEADNSRGISFYTSDNLVDWEWKSHIHGFYECPDLIKLPVENRPDENIWVIFDADGSYLLGNFDGNQFTPSSGKMKSDWGSNYYATQSWSNIPKEDGRTIQIAWMRNGKYPEMPFNGQMTFPSELSVTETPAGYKLVRKPAREMESILKNTFSIEDKKVIPGINDNKLKRVSGDCLRIVGEFDLKTSDAFGLMLRNNTKVPGTEILYNVKRGTLTILGSTIPLLPENNKIKLDILLDRCSIEVYANNGKAVATSNFTPDPKAKDLILFTNGGELGIDKLDVFEVESVWRD